MRKLAGWAALAFLVFFVAHDPHGAASLARQVGSGLGSVASGFATAVSSTAGGR